MHLAAVEGLETLPPLVRALGLAPEWRDVRIERLAGSSYRVRRAVVVGSRPRFLAIALDAAPAGAAKRVAYGLAVRAQTGLVLGWDPGRRSLSFSVAFADCPTVTIAVDRPTPADLRRLERGAGGDEIGAILAARWAEALSGQDLGTRFFVQFKGTLDEFVGSLAPSIPRRERHALSLLALTRVLFLYFVQDKGWLDNRPRFLREELDRALTARRLVDRDLLQPLFFGTLNRPSADRRRLARALGDIPFLNGGLFERHPLERQWRPAYPNRAWREAFDTLFERYHFSGSGNAEQDGRIGPDMLGRVFEGVMDANERRDAGAFYTPMALVSELVDAALTEWLGFKCGLSAAAAERALDDPSPTAIASLDGVTILDPAVGSGAFLLGALRRLVAMRVTRDGTAVELTRRVLASNLFGVDINPNAVRLAELRLWLEVISAEDSGAPGRVGPLPNLDGCLRQGDSLTDPTTGLAPPGAGARGLRVLRQAAATTSGPDKRRTFARLRRAELAAGQASIDRAIELVEHRLQESRATIRAPDLFGAQTPATRQGRAAHAALRAERRRLRALARRLGETGELPWFHYAAQFGDIMTAGGFDIVIGNPPWVRGEAQSRSRRRELRRRYRWCRSAIGTHGGYAHAADLSLAFLERGFELLQPNGVLSMLIPAKFATVGYARAARSELSRRATLLVAETMGERGRRAFDATVFPLALVAARRPPTADHRVRTSLVGPAIPSVRQSSLGPEPWSLSPSTAVAEAVARRQPRLGLRFVVRLGVKTGCDRAFLDPPATVEPGLVRPVIRGRDVKAFKITPRRNILWTHDRAGVVLRALPPGADNHLASHRRRLSRRSDLRRGPYWALFRTAAANHPVRLVWADLSRTLEVAALTSRGEANVVPLNTTYVMFLPDRNTALRIAAWLNTTWLRAMARAHATVAASGYVRFNTEVVSSLPLPTSVLSDPALLEIGRRAVDGPFDQEAADSRSALLLSLTDAERGELRRIRPVG